MRTICTGNTCNPLRTGQNADPKETVRAARVQAAALTAFALLATLTLVGGALGYSGHLAKFAQVFSKNALWVTLAGSLAIALGILTAAGCYYTANKKTHQPAQPPQQPVAGKSAAEGEAASA